MPVDRRDGRAGAGGDDDVPGAVRLAADLDQQPAVLVAPGEPARRPRRRSRPAPRTARRRRGRPSRRSPRRGCGSRRRRSPGSSRARARQLVRPAATRRARRRRAASSSTGCSRSRGTRRRPGARPRRAPPGRPRRACRPPLHHRVRARARSRRSPCSGPYRLTGRGVRDNGRREQRSTGRDGRPTPSTRPSAARRRSAGWSTRSTPAWPRTRCCGRSTPRTTSAAAAERLRLFLMQYWGGPGTYSQQRGHPRLRMRHAAVRDRRRRARRLAGPHARAPWTPSTCRRPTTARSGST